MAIVFESAPSSAVTLAGQPLIFTVREDAGAPPSRFVIEVYNSYSVTGNEVLRGKFYLTPNPNSRAHFDLSKIAEGILTYPLAEGSTVVHKFSVPDYTDGPTVRRFKLKQGKFTNGTETIETSGHKEIFLTRGVFQVTDGFNQGIATRVVGGGFGWLLKNYDLGASAIFGSVVTVLRMPMNPNENRVATALLGEDMGYPVTGSDVVVKYVFNKNDGTQSVVAKNFESLTTASVRTRMFQIPLGWAGAVEDMAPAGFDLTNTLGVWIYMARGAGGGVIDELIEVTYDSDLGCKNTATQVAYINEFGGWEYLRFDSRAPKQVSVTSKTYRKNTGSWQQATFSLAPNEPQYEDYAKVGKRRYTLQENFFSEEQREALESLLKSNVVQIRRMDETDWQPVNVLTNSLTIEPSGSKFYNVSLQVEIANDIRC